MALSQAQLITEYPFNANPDAPFASAAEMSAAMGNPKYAVDENFRQIVASRVANTDKSEWGLVSHRPPINFKMTSPFELTREDDATGEEANW